MKSTIKVELGPLNQPVIRMRIHHTDDVRDRLFVQFKERLGSISNLCEVKIDDGFTSGAPDGLRCILEIYPIGPEQLKDMQSLPTPGKFSDDLPSRYKIDDSVSTEDIFDGQVVAVRFTIGKVYYDILNKLTGDVIRDVDSAEIVQDTVKLSQA